jgi:hypothetical protein
MSWAGITNNQCVSRNNLQNAVNTGVFTLKNTIPADNKQITRTEAEYYVNINPITAKQNNQLVVKTDLGNCTPLAYSAQLFFQGWEPYFNGTSTGAGACAITDTWTDVFTSSSSIGVGSSLYFDACGTQQINAVSYDQTNPYFKINGKYVTFENWDATGTGYIIRTAVSCSTSSYGWLFNGGGAGFSTSAAALATWTGGPYRYSNINGMVSTVTTFYSDSALIYPFNGGDLWYCCQLNGSGTRYAALINSSGLVTSYTT